MDAFLEAALEESLEAAVFFSPFSAFLARRAALDEETGILTWVVGQVWSVVQIIEDFVRQAPKKRIGGVSLSIVGACDKDRVRRGGGEFNRRVR